MLDQSRKVIYEILQVFFSIEQKFLSPEYDNRSLLEKPFNLDAIDLTYLFLELEKRLKISISKNSLDNYGIITIKGILQGVSNCITDEF